MGNLGPRRRINLLISTVNPLYSQDNRGPCLEFSPIITKKTIYCFCSAYKTHSLQKLQSKKKTYKEGKPPSDYLEMCKVNVILQN